MKYVLMFFTFLSVCTPADLLKIPLTLDATQSVTIPSGITSIDETFKVDPSQDPDFQNYLQKIKGYEIDSITIAPESWDGAKNTTFDGSVKLIDLNMSYPVTLNLATVSYIPISANATNLIDLASTLSKAGLMNINFKGTLSNNSGGNLKLKFKVYLKIKVL